MIGRLIRTTNMLPKNNRLAAKGDFARLFSKGRAAGGKFMVLKSVPNKREMTRMGFVVSTKVSKRAVVRNQIRRRLREAVRLMLPRVVGGYDAALIVKKGAEAADFQALAAEVNSLMVKAKLLKS